MIELRLELRKAYDTLKAEQAKLEPLLPIRMMTELLGASATTVQGILEELVSAGLAEEVQTGETGTRKRYRIL